MPQFECCQAFTLSLRRDDVDLRAGPVEAPFWLDELGRLEAVFDQRGQV